MMDPHITGGRWDRQDGPLPPDGEGRNPGLTGRSILWLLGWTVVSLLWIRQASLIDFSCLVGEGTPALPAVVALTFLGVLGPRLWRRSRRLSLSRAESLALYVGLTIIAPISCANIVRQLLPTLTVLRYFATPENRFAEFAEQLPSWLAPREPSLILEFYEGSDTGAVPWAAWAVPLLVWAGVIVLYTATLLCWIALFRKPWTEHERLAYPLVHLAVQLVDSGHTAASASPRPRTSGPLWGSWLFWLGFSVPAVFNLLNIAHLFNPNVPATGLSFDPAVFLSERPWSWLLPMPIHFRPEVVGLAYFAPQEACFSVWFFYLLLRFEKFFAEAVGWSVAGMPFDAAQARGAYLALTLLLIYGARRHLGTALRSALGLGRTGAEAQEPIPYRWAFLGGILGTVGLWSFCVRVGVRPVTAGLFIGLLLAMPLVYSRMRAEMGIPMSYAWPIGDGVRGMFQTFGSRFLGGSGGLRPLVALSTLAVLDRMALPNFMADGLEAMRAEEVVRARRRDLVIGALGVGLLIGIAGGYLTHLTAYYTYGNNVIDGGTVLGGYRTYQARVSFEPLTALASSPAPPERRQILFLGLGFGVTVVLVVLRSVFLRFPLHPLGFAVAAAYGHVPWFAFLTAWALKAVLQRLGGAPLRLRLAPAFFGLALGHYLVGGALWGALGMLTPKAKEYIVWFC